MGPFSHKRFEAVTLTACEKAPTVRRILSAALEAVDPAAALHKSVRREGNSLFIQSRPIDLDAVGRIYLVGAGKAGVPMARAAIQIVGERLTNGVMIVKEGHLDGIDQESSGPAHRLGPIRVYEAGHPLPDRRGVSATAALIALLSQIRADDLLLCLLSGGGSALLTQPVPGITLADMQSLTGMLLACGATIHEINVLRKHLDAIKGGGLARMAAPAHIETLILSDVVGNPLDIIASGPTVPDPSTYQDVGRVLDRYQLWDRLPVAMRKFLRQGMTGRRAETPKPGDPLFEKVTNTLIGSNEQAAQAALLRAEQEGLNTQLLTTRMQGEARHAGRWLAQVARSTALEGQPVSPPACLVAGGETTVTLGESPGRGGRNLELALSAVEELAGLDNVLLISLATDGGDGPTDAAGAVVSGQTMARAQQQGLLPADYLNRHDSYAYFDRLGDLLKTGPTLTNVNDLAFVFSFDFQTPGV